MPDLEKIIAMSDLFEVTTDYILKGIGTALIIQVISGMFVDRK